jgi:hypothetical protein
VGNEPTGCLVCIAGGHRLNHIQVVLHIIKCAVLGKPVEKRAHLVFGRHGPPAIEAMLPEYGLVCRNSTLVSDPDGSVCPARLILKNAKLRLKAFLLRPRRRLGAITKTGSRRARRARVEGAWAYRHPAKVSEHIQRRIDTLPKPLQDLGWKAQVRLCTRFRRLVARGKHPNVAVTAIARELVAFMWAIAKEVPITA